jgi:tRNA-splicing ligase RtcB
MPYTEHVRLDDNSVPIKSWAVNAEEGAFEQAWNLAHLPFAISHIALMPDAHQGYGMPIGGVLFADKAVVPYAVGVDIGCGVSLIETDVPDWELTHEQVEQILAHIYKTVPVGTGGNHRKPQGEEFYTDTLKIPERMINILMEADLQLGTLGSGNHFLELQRDDDHRINFMLHSGSRGVGKKVCDYWHKVALRFNEKYHSILPHKELAYLPSDSDEGYEYVQEMNVAMAWAEENRRRMAGKVIEAFGNLGIKAWQVLDVHHNYAAWENHMGKNGIVHRKGAVRARKGEQVLIPGSMGTSSYLAEGLGNPLSFETCQHGAGRLRSRGATRKMTTVEEMEKTLQDANVTLVTGSRAGVIDESPLAYKDIEEVMVASSDLITPLRRFTPIGVVKG